MRTAAAATLAHTTADTREAVETGCTSCFLTRSSGMTARSLSNTRERRIERFVVKHEPRSHGVDDAGGLHVLVLRSDREGTGECERDRRPVLRIAPRHATLSLLA